MAEYDIPKEGDRLKRQDFDMIMEAVRQRQENFPDEPATLSLFVVMTNIGDRYSEVICSEGEWTDVKENVIPTDGPPLCPNGHEVFVVSKLTLGWVSPEI